MKYFDKLELGMCYYPEHWDESLWLDDLHRMREAGISVIRIAEFAWNKFENTEGVFTFDFFDHFLDVLETTDMKVIFCTPTATPPAWLTATYPEVLNRDLDGQRYYHGARRHCNYNSLIYRTLSARIVEQLVRHYCNRTSIIGWQIDNEFNCVVDEFYSEADHKEFRFFVKDRYKTLDKLNDAWGTVFWNQTYNDWEQIYLPRHTQRDTANPHLKLDSLRFFSESCLKYCKMQYDILKKYLPKHIFVTTNGIFKHIDYHKMKKTALDFLSYDSYPAFGLIDLETPLQDRKWSMNLSKVRGNGGTFAIMEQQFATGGWQSWFRPQEAAKPGQCRLWTFQSIAHGADFVSYFRWRTCPFGTEMYWNGILNYDNLDNKRLEDLKQIAKDVSCIENVVGMPYQAQVAVLWDYDNEWDGETDLWHGPLRKMSHINIFRVLQEKHIPYDYVTVSGMEDLELLKKYEAIFAPHMTIMNSDIVSVIKEYVKDGGIFITGARTGYKDVSGRCLMEIMPVGMTDLFGIHILDFSPAGDEKTVVMFHGKEVPMPLFHDMLTPVEDSCQVLAVYQDPYYEGTAAITCKSYGKGYACYFGAAFSVEGVEELLLELDIQSKTNGWLDVPECCEVAVRSDGEKEYVFILNYTEQKQNIDIKVPCWEKLKKQKIEGIVTMLPFGVIVLERC